MRVEPQADTVSKGRICEIVISRDQELGARYMGISSPRHGRSRIEKRELGWEREHLNSGLGISLRHQRKSEDVILSSYSTISVPLATKVLVVVNLQHNTPTN